ncbi:hypothetical protein DBR06_SOUSAS5010031 [Sousa chinensis]|nr:hypothetical protein DBR06_SOUSAS5010031 [Sousa chinensis]
MKSSPPPAQSVMGELFTQHEKSGQSAGTGGLGPPSAGSESRQQCPWAPWTGKAFPRPSAMPA